MCSVAVYTLGCKLNQLESEAIAAAFRQAGFQLLPWDGSPAILIINTCTVTSKADQKARRFIRKTLRENPLACVIVTGCYAQLEPDAIEGLEAECAGTGGRRLFVLKGEALSAGERKSALLDLPAYLQTAEAVAAASATEVDATVPSSAQLSDLRSLLNTWSEERTVGDAFRFRPEVFFFHTRGLLKIQDGCDNHCTYCRVRIARGPSVSHAAEQALAELLALEARGCAEAVLTGVNISQYYDPGLRDPSGDLAGLLEYLLAHSRSTTLRLSSLEPEGITGSLAAVLAHPRIRPHFHLSVQSGSPQILARMGRPYGPETVEQAAALLRSVKDNPFLACDIITGFPGETEADFEQTLYLCRNIGFAWIHAFPYSKRPGTAACSFRETVSQRDTARRVDTLLELARQGRRQYIQSWTGRELEALIERGNAGTPGCCRGISCNYLKLLIQYSGRKAPQPGTLLRCRVGEIHGNPEYDAKATEVKRRKSPALDIVSGFRQV